MPIYRDDRLGNPHRIGLTDAERAVYVTGKGTTNVPGRAGRSLAEVYDIVPGYTSNAQGIYHHWEWKLKPNG